MRYRCLIMRRIMNSFVYTENNMREIVNSCYSIYTLYMPYPYLLCVCLDF
jgi:hypothetical protein